MRVVVCGGSGFLGSHVADALTKAGHEVVVFDLVPSAYLGPGQKMVVGDVLDAKSVQDATSGADCVYNFAGIADLDNASTRPADTVTQNILGNVNILNACLDAKVKRFVYASTVYVYSPLGGFYRCSKQASEVYVEEYQRKYDLSYTILRYGTLYGPRAADSNSIHSYLKQALVSGQIKGNGTGEEVREYIHVRDAAQLSVDILDEKFANRHVIITGHHPMKFADMLAMIKEILNGQVKIEYAIETDSAHYNMTPYSFTPKIGQKLVTHCYTDMGQGLIECLHELYDELTAEGLPARGNEPTVEAT